jgi:hypothetical protein
MCKPPVSLVYTSLSLVFTDYQAVVPEVGWQLPATVVGILLAASIVIYIVIRILTHRHEEHGPARKGKT